jgi:transketolase
MPLKPARRHWPLPKLNGPVYIRLAREKTPQFTLDDTPFEIGKAQIFREGKDVTIAAAGPQVYYALEAAE